MYDDIDKTRVPASSLKLLPENTEIGDGANFLFTDERLVSKLTARNGFSPLDSALTSTMYGIDLFNNPSPAQQVHEQFGLVFFTRPMLNLSYDNVTAVRSLTPLATNETTSIGRYVRALLDPLGKWPCPLLDQESVFMPILSNTLENLTGWQDPMVDTWTSASGLKKDAYTMVDSANDVFAPTDLSAMFRNTRGNVLGYLFHVWQTYMSLQFAGKIDPYPEFYEHFTVDYQTRIYHLILDPTRQFVEDVVCTGSSFPLANPAGARANYNRSEVVNQEIYTISQSFRSMGMFYYDPGYMYDFNTATGLLRPGFNDDNLREKQYRILYPMEYKLFTYRAFPRVNPKTARLEWWVKNEVHEQIMGKVSYAGSRMGPTSLDWQGEKWL